MVSAPILSFEAIGVGPPVLLLHGLVSSSRYFDRVARELSHDHRVLRVDLLGFGRSPRPAVAYTPDDHVDALVDTLSAAGIDGGMPVVGHSAGGIVALGLARRKPSRVSGLLLAGAPLYPDAASARAHLAGMGPMARLFALPGPVASRTCAWVCNHREIAARLAVLTHPRFPAAVAAASVDHSWASYSGTLEHVVVGSAASDWIDGIDAPIRVVAGADDPVVDRGHLRRLAARHAGFTFDEWGGDHHLPLRRPVDLASAIRELG